MGNAIYSNAMPYSTVKAKFKEFESLPPHDRISAVKGYLADKKPLMVKREDLHDTLRLIDATFRDDEPWFRAISSTTIDDYVNSGLMIPQSGDFWRVGEPGVFFTNSYVAVISHADSRKIIVATTRKLLDPEGRVVDTRVRGYDIPFKERFPDIHPYDFWREVTKNDTITTDGNSCTFSKRSTVTKKDLVAELIIV